MFRISQLFGVFSVRALGFDADFTPSTERTMCSFMGLTLLFRGLVRLWWHLYLDLLMCVLILIMDISLNFFAVVRDLAVLDSKLVPGALCE